MENDYGAVETTEFNPEHSGYYWIRIIKQPEGLGHIYNSTMDIYTDTNEIKEILDHGGKIRVERGHYFKKKSFCDIFKNVFNRERTSAIKCDDKRKNDKTRFMPTFAWG